MRKRYGDALRKDAGVTKIIKKVAKKNARILESRAGKHGDGIRRVAKEVKGSFDKVFEETAEVVEEFLNKCKRKSNLIILSLMLMFDYSKAKIRGSSSGYESHVATVKRKTCHHVRRFTTSAYVCVLTLYRRIASDLSSFDTTMYKVVVAATRNHGKYRFHLGEPITMDWRAPASHSRKDWIGLYRVRSVSFVLYC